MYERYNVTTHLTLALARSMLWSSIREEAEWTVHRASREPRGVLPDFCRVHPNQQPVTRSHQ